MRRLHYLRYKLFELESILLLSVCSVLCLIGSSFKTDPLGTTDTNRLLFLPKAKGKKYLLCKRVIRRINVSRAKGWMDSVKLRYLKQGPFFSQGEGESPNALIPRLPQASSDFHPGLALHHAQPLFKYSQITKHTVGLIAQVFPSSTLSPNLDYLHSQINL